MAKLVRIKRITHALQQQVAGTIEAGVLPSIVTLSEPSAVMVHQALVDLAVIPRREIFAACAEAILRYGIENHRMTNSNNSRNRLAFLIARWLIRRSNELRKTNTTVKTLYDGLKKFDQNTIRKALVPLASNLCEDLLRPVPDCADCTARRSRRACTSCNQALCPWHCYCAVSGSRDTTKRRRRSKLHGG